MSTKYLIGLSVAWPLAIAAVVVFGVAWCAMGAAYCKANPKVTLDAHGKPERNGIVKSLKAIQQLVRDTLHNFVGWIRCLRNRHDWELTLDDHGNNGGDLSSWIGGPTFFVKGLPSRHCIFTCSRCGKTAEFHRWAFVPGSGSLHSFFDKWWPYAANQTGLRSPRFGGDKQDQVVLPSDSRPK